MNQLLQAGNGKNELAPPAVLATQMVARDMLTYSVGDALPTTTEYRDRLGVGSGTVQKVLRGLQDAGAIRTQPRGYRGTFLLDIHLGRLWSIAAMSPVICAYPSQTEEAHGLLEAVAATYEHLSVPYFPLMHIPGAHRRLAMVHSGKATMAVMSQGVYDAEVTQATDSPDVNISAVSLQPYTYYRKGSLVVLAAPGMDRSALQRRRLVVAIDRSSYDHQQLTQAQFPDRRVRQFIDVPYDELPLQVAKGSVDAAVWHQVRMPIPLNMVGVSIQSLTTGAALVLAEQLSTAVIVARKDYNDQTGILQLLDPQLLSASIHNHTSPPVPSV